MSVLAVAACAGLVIVSLAAPLARPAHALNNGAERLPADALALIELHNLQDWPASHRPSADGRTPAMPTATVDAFEALLPDAARLWSVAHDVHARALGADAPLTRAAREAVTDLYAGVLSVGARGANVAILLEVPAAVDVTALFDAQLRAPGAALRQGPSEGGWGRARLTRSIACGARKIAFEFAWREREWWLATDARSLTRALAAEDAVWGDLRDPGDDDGAGPARARLADVSAYRDAVARHPKLRFDTARLQDVWMWVDVAATVEAIAAFTPEGKRAALGGLAERLGLHTMQAVICSTARVAPPIADDDAGANGDNPNLNDGNTNRQFTNDGAPSALATAPFEGGATAVLHSTALDPRASGATAGPWWLAAAREGATWRHPDLLAAVPANALGYATLSLRDVLTAWDRYVRDQSRLMADWPEQFGDRFATRLDQQVVALDFHSGYPIETLIRQLAGEIAVAWLPPRGAEEVVDDADQQVRDAEGRLVPEVLSDRDGLFVARVRNRERAADVLANWLNRLVADDDRDSGGAGEGQPAVIRDDRDGDDETLAFTVLGQRVAPFIGGAVVGDVLLLGDARHGAIERAVDALLGDAPSVLSETSALRPTPPTAAPTADTLVRWAFSNGKLSPYHASVARAPPTLLPLLDAAHRTEVAARDGATHAAAFVARARAALLVRSQSRSLVDAWDACAGPTLDPLRALAAAACAR